ncbi:hypothetical protein DM02DRAFT_381080 [Periconia macrospinosa]|uniref:AMMECR1 domain-containing protein n=1 Tax=Periconia macrospinosa TaxID=97972 RepID=A0A2V1EC95_9PLEO|nr:hypothetical protein DM02DRAFT_381080 [Periconia macrospinosa]
MASQAHCAYCFEILSSSLEKRSPLTLRQVEQLWKQYTADPNEAAEDETEPSDSVEDSSENATPASSSATYRPAAVSRLLAPSPSTASSTSVQSTTSSTPSAVSEASSATSKNSSGSSVLSSLGKRLRGAEKERSDEGSPLFVTWNTIQRDGEKRLRGCIGTFQPQELDDGLRSYALTAAFEDTRFHPITLRELPSLEAGVTLLTDFESISDPMDWTLGVHGLRISFDYNKRRYGSTYLPDVAKEQGWTKTETMISLMRKAGWNGRSSEWDQVDLKVVRYQGRQAKLGYREWKEWRDWVESVEE